MKDFKVAILMSTYNGELYIRQQIDSIIHQSYSNWILYIRDDGSNDQTVKIIEEYSKKYDNIVFFNKDNIENYGVVHSFLELLQKVNADFYMFADQDDYWKENKVLDTLHLMLSEPYDNLPICVHTNLTAVDKTLKNEVVTEPKRVWSSFQKVLFSNCVTGCTVMINNGLKNKIKFENIRYQNVVMHDWWVALIASQFGKLVYLKKSTMLYRQHGDNVDGSQKKNTIGWLFHRLTHYDYDRLQMRKNITMINEFSHNYIEELSGKDKEYVKRYSQLVNKGSFLHNLLLGIQCPPQERTMGGCLFFVYLMTAFYKDLLHLDLKL